MEVVHDGTHIAQWTTYEVVHSREGADVTARAAERRAGNCAQHNPWYSVPRNKKQGVIA